MAHGKAVVPAVAGRKKTPHAKVAARPNLNAFLGLPMQAGIIRGRHRSGGPPIDLLARFCASVGVDFGAESDLDNLRGLPAHIEPPVLVMQRTRPALRTNNAAAQP
jgi:hypothetical protein